MRFPVDQIVRLKDEDYYDEDCYLAFDEFLDAISLPHLKSYIKVGGLPTKHQNYIIVGVGKHPCTQTIIFALLGISNQRVYIVSSNNIEVK